MCMVVHRHHKAISELDKVCHLYMWPPHHCGRESPPLNDRPSRSELELKSRPDIKAEEYTRIKNIQNKTIFSQMQQK